MKRGYKVWGGTNGAFKVGHLFAIGTEFANKQGNMGSHVVP